jgi:hypothetical protein
MSKGMKHLHPLQLFVLLHLAGACAAPEAQTPEYEGNAGDHVSRRTHAAPPGVRAWGTMR